MDGIKVTELRDMPQDVQERAKMMGWTRRVESARLVVADDGSMVPAWGRWE